MKSVLSDSTPQIPSCKIRGRLFPYYDFLPRLKKLCLSLGFNNPIIKKSGKLAPPSEQRLDNIIPGDLSESQDKNYGHDHIIILSTMIPYEQDWGGYSGLPGQYCLENHGGGIAEIPSNFILPYLQQYHFAQTHILMGCDSTGRFVVTLPDFLFREKEGHEGKLRVIIEKIAEPDIQGRIEPLMDSGPLVTFSLALQFRQAMENKNFPWKPGLLSPIREHLCAEMFYFLHPSEPDHSQNPFSAMLLPMMPWIVSHRTPHLAATLVHLQNNFLREREAFSATGPDDLRNLLCVAGLDIDMKGFRGRKERYFVPWQACWKRHGYCYDNIYPLLQDDLFVALMNFKAEDSSEN